MPAFGTVLIYKETVHGTKDGALDLISQLTARERVDFESCCFSFLILYFRVFWAKNIRGQSCDTAPLKETLKEKSRDKSCLFIENKN